MARLLVQIRKRVLFPVLLALLALPALAGAQGTLGSLTGIVRDASDAVLPGATVTLTNPGTGFSQTEVTTGIGTFTFPQLPVGTYTVEIALEGFKTQTYTGVVINVGQQYSLNAKLSIGEISETVQVTSGELLVKTTTPEVSATVLQKQVLEIPLANRDVTNLIKTQAGVARHLEPHEHRRSTAAVRRGRRSRSTASTSRTTSSARTRSTSCPNRPNSDNVAEFAITTSVSGADSAGGATSVRMVTPSGTNTFRGSVFEFNRDNKFAANSFFNNAATPKVPKAELIAAPVRRASRRPDPQEQAVLLRQLRGLPAGDADVAEPDDPGQRRLLQRRVPLRRRSTGTVRSVNVMQLYGAAASTRSSGPTFLSKIPGSSNVEQLRRRQLDRGARR